MAYGVQRDTGFMTWKKRSLSKRVAALGLKPQTADNSSSKDL